MGGTEQAQLALAALSATETLNPVYAGGEVGLVLPAPGERTPGAMAAETKAAAETKDADARRLIH